MSGGMKEQAKGPADGGSPSITARLVERGESLFRAPATAVAFTGQPKVPEADALLNDLAGHPHAFVLACVMDRQIKAERAWQIPYRLSQELGDFTFERLRGVSEEEYERLFRTLKLHRFPEVMSRSFWAAMRRIGRLVRRTGAEDLGRSASQYGGCVPVLRV